MACRMAARLPKLLALRYTRGTCSMKYQCSNVGVCCKEADLNAANRIAALMEPEHRPLIVERFSRW